MPDPTEEFFRQGATWFRQALSPKILADLDALASVGSGNKRISLSDVPLNVSVCLCRVLDDLIGTLKLTRVVGFDKSPSRNWGVPWHQDRVIAVADRHSVKGYKKWTQKSGIWHCEPPIDVLNTMIFARVFLDDCDVENGAMAFALGSHRFGLVSEEEAEQRALACPIQTETAARGDVLALNMLTLHRSHPSKTGTPRSVLRMDFTGCDLPLPLQWAHV